MKYKPRKFRPSAAFSAAVLLLIACLAFSAAAEESDGSVNPEDPAMPSETLQETYGWLPETGPEEAAEPSWVLSVPEMPNIASGERIVPLATATVSEVENLGEHVIYLTVSYTDGFTGEGGWIPMMLFVGDNPPEPVSPGVPAVYGAVANNITVIKPVYLVLGEDTWASMASGQYHMTLSYDSFVN